MDCTSMGTYYKQRYKQGIRILFSQVSIVYSAKNLFEITPVVVVGMRKGGIGNLLLTESIKNCSCFFRNLGDLFSCAGDREMR